MKLVFIFLVILLLIFIPIPIKIILHYSFEDYYIKIYNLTIISKKRPPKRDEPVVKKERKFFANVFTKVDYESMLSNIYNLNIKFKPKIKFKFLLEYSLNDAARTAISYGVLCQLPQLLYLFLKFIFNVSKFNIKINPIFEDKLLLKIESSSIIFLSFANIIYITMIFLRTLSKQGR